MDASRIAAVEAAERQREAALLAGDAEALEALLSADLVYIHGNGQREGKAEYMRRFRADEYVFLAIVRNDECVIAAGDAMVVTGRRAVTVSPPGIGVTRVNSVATCIWRNEGIDGGCGPWRLVLYHGTFLPG